MMDKDWVRLNRTTKEYEQAAWNFVNDAKRNLGNVEKILCPCLDCRNLTRLHGEVIVEHLIIKGMDPKYMGGEWYNHDKRINKRRQTIVNTNILDTIEKVKKIESESQSNSISSSLREDVIVQVLGQDRPGRLRAIGRGANYTKSLLLQAKDARISQLEEEVRMLKNNLSTQLINGCRREESMSQNNDGKSHNKCDLLDWNGTDEIVAEGRVMSSDPNKLVHRIPLGPNAKVVLIEFPRKLDAFLWRAVVNTIHIGEAVGMSVAWPADKVIMHKLDQLDTMYGICSSLIRWGVHNMKSEEIQAMIACTEKWECIRDLE